MKATHKRSKSKNKSIKSKPKANHKSKKSSYY